MIKIIRDGLEEKPTINIYTVECPNCHCIFECDYHDFDWQTRGFDFKAGLKCPHCGTQLTLDDNTPYRVEVEKEEE